MADVFRPRLPLDPFAALDAPNPWQLQPFSAPIHPPRHILLVLGAPSYADLAPLVSSPHLSASLLVLATHTPPPLDRPSHSTSRPGPAILILHLPAPLAVHDAGAVRLVSLLERAQRAAAAWVAAPAPRILQLGEDGPGGEFVVPEEPEVSQQRHSPAAPRGPAVPNPSPLNPYAPGSTSPASSFASLAYTLPHSKPKSRTKARPSAPVPFTALLSFLPSGLPEKALLKHAILVTTLSAPFLSTNTTAHPPVPVLIPSSAPSVSSTSSLPRSSRRSILAALPFSSLSLPASAHPHPRRRSRLSSLFSASSHRLLPPASPSVDSLARAQAPAPACKPHLVHVLPYSAFHPPQQPLSKHRPHSLSHHLAIPGAASPGAGSSLGHSRASMGAGAGAGQPRSKTKLVQSIEQFLLSFAYPLVLPSLASRGGSLRQPSLVPSPSGLGGLRGSRTAPPSPVRTSPVHGLPPPVPPPSAYPKASSTSALARPASAQSHSQSAAASRSSSPSHHPRVPSASSASSYHKPRAPSSSASSVSSAPRSRPVSTYSTYSTISGISALSGASGEGGGKKGHGVVPYIVPAGVLGCSVVGVGVGSGSGTDAREAAEGKAGFSLGEAVVLGLLDAAAEGEGWPRAWIGEAGEVVQGEDVPSDGGYERYTGPVADGDGGVGVGGADTEPEPEDEKDKDKATGKEKGKGKAQQKPERPGKSKKRVRRNEAGLPTPPESSSSLDSASGSGSEDGDGYVRVRRGSGAGFGSEAGGEEVGMGAGAERWGVGAGGVAFPGAGEVDVDVGGSVEEGSVGPEVPAGGVAMVQGQAQEKGKRKKTLRTRVSSFFGRRRERGVPGVPGGVERGRGSLDGNAGVNAKGKGKERGALGKRMGWGRG